VALSPLRGEFRAENGEEKTVFPDAEYRMDLHLLNHADAFSPLLNDLVVQDEAITVGDVDMELCSIESEERGFDDFVEPGTPRQLRFHFTSPACIQYKSSGVNEMFPHREAVFRSLHHSWSQHAPDELCFELDTADLKRHVVEQPDAGSYDTHNVVVTRWYDESAGHDRPVKEFGFTGKTTYRFKNAAETLKHKLAVLTRWAHYSGVGSHTARGCGSVNTEVRAG
jgi:hypothetical protein